MAAKQSGQGGLLAVMIAWIIALAALVYCCVLKLLINNGALEKQVYDASADVAGVIFLIGSALGLGLTCIQVVCSVRKARSNSDGALENMRRLISGQTQNEAILTQISENLLLSDAVKSVAFREKDRQVLEEAIQQDFRSERWDSALILIDELADRFGCKTEAQKLRGELESYRRATIQEKIDASIKHIESLWMIHNYVDAEREVDTLMKLYPNSNKVQSLEGQTEKRRQEHKKELLERWDRAVKNNDVDQGVELLKLLDNYLSPTEAAALEEAARGVFRAKLHNSGMQFSLLVTEKKWTQALKIGKEIIEEFPNTRMAQEVRDKLHILEEKAQG